MRPVRRTLVPEAAADLAVWARLGAIGSAELHGAAVLVRADPTADDTVLLAAALALWAPLHGHACIDLADAQRVVGLAIALDRDDHQRDDNIASTDTGAAGSIDGVDRLVDALPWPEPQRWASTLRACAICRTVVAPDPVPVFDDRPLVLHGTMLYTQRQWADECIVAADLHRRSRASTADDLPAASASLLQQLLPATDDGHPNLQHAAALMALQSRLAVIVGGPGTGKTHTIARLLAVVVHRAHTEGRTLRVALAAPTGKAAARMGEALNTAITALAAVHGDVNSDVNGDVQGDVHGAGVGGGAHGAVDGAVVDSLVALRPTTIHRLLGVRGRRTRFVHDGEHPLDHDIVIIDEASMVALPMMARLVESLRPDTTLVLVGDPDQLESIEVGSVLADIVAASRITGSPMGARVVRLDRPRRHVAGSPIGPLSDAIRLADAAAVVRLLTSPAEHGDAITFVDTAAASADRVDDAIRNAVVPRLQAAVAAAKAGQGAAALAQFADVRVLCAHRRGPYGVETWNRAIEAWLLADAPAARPPRYYPGRPLLVTRNDQRQRIANGDTGIIVTTDSGELRAAFDTADGLRLLAPAQLDTVETAFAMTIHKSQGSEYATVVVVLPPAGSALIGRELLYTAITRATRRLVVVGTVGALVAAVETPGQRVTGLTEALAVQPSAATA